MSISVPSSNSLRFVPDTDRGLVEQERIMSVGRRNLRTKMAQDNRESHPFPGQDNLEDTHSRNGRIQMILHAIEAKSHSDIS